LKDRLNARTSLRRIFLKMVCSEKQVQRWRDDSSSSLFLRYADELDVFPHDKDLKGHNVICDPAINGDATLLAVGNQALFTRSNRLYSFKLRLR
jgi:hypothetical protein